MPHHGGMVQGEVRRTPEDEHLAEQERLFVELAEQLATIGAEFAVFRATYLARFAPLYLELDRLEAEIARLLPIARNEVDARMPDAPEATSMWASV